MSRVHADVRRQKETRPQEFCPDRKCLWRYLHRDGRVTPCPRHSVRAADIEQLVTAYDNAVAAMLPETVPSITERLARFSVERITDDGIIKRTTFSELYQVTERGAEHRHLVTVRLNEDGRETTTCQSHPEGCDAVAAVTATRLSEAHAAKDE